MPLLETATKQDIARLLELFPVRRLKDAFSEHSGTKDEISVSAANAATVDRINKFVTDNITKCKLHTYVFEKPEGEQVDLLAAIPGAELIAWPDKETTIILTRVKFGVLLQNPYEDQEIEFLWPMRIRTVGDRIILSVVVFERSASQYFERDGSVRWRDLEEKKIVSDIVALGAKEHNLHKGVKALWKQGFMDAYKTRYKKPHSMATEEMDEALGIRANNQPLFNELMGCTLFNTTFRTAIDSGCSVEAFQVNPSTGSISFPRYTEKGGDTDEVVTAILDANT